MCQKYRHPFFYFYHENLVGKHKNNSSEKPVVEEEIAVIGYIVPVCYSYHHKAEESHSHPSRLRFVFLAKASPRSFWDFSGCPLVALRLARALRLVQAPFGIFRGASF